MSGEQRPSSAAYGFVGAGAITAAIVVAVRPDQAPGVFERLSFGQQHVVMSVIASVPLERLHDWVAPASHVVRVIPLPSAASGRSLTVMYPDNAVARELFGRVGNLVVPRDGTTLDTFSAASSTFAAHLDYLTTIAQWMTEHGVEDDAATAYITHIFGDLGESLRQQTESLAALTDMHMTPGGINQQFMNCLRRDGVPDNVRRGLDQILDRLRQ